jgi:hypothetical protein
MKLNAGVLAFALQLQEAIAAELSAGDILSRLRDALADNFRGTSSWGYYIDHIGDGSAGDVIYTCDGDTFKAPYTIIETPGAATCSIAFDEAVDVIGRMVWEPEAEEADHYAAMEESLKKAGLCSSLPLYERFISKKERDDASADDFAGKGRSFPILKPEDVTAAAKSIGRAGDKNLGPSGLKARIIAIAKRKGWAKYLPKAWQSGDDDKKSEAAAPAALPAGSIALHESAAPAEEIIVQEAKADYRVKLIAPGKGSSAFYPAEVLKRDGPRVFKAGTHMYVNHPTAAEEAARPEGDWRKLAAVLTEDAVYDEAGPKGAGLYSRMKVFSDHCGAVEEKAPYTGVSIRAAGIAEAGRVRDGVPVLKELVSAESVDLVTRAGAGGMILTEAAKPAISTEVPDMTQDEAKKLIESATAPLYQRLRIADAREIARETLGTVTLPEAARSRIIERVLSNIPTTEAGEIDRPKFNEVLVAEAKAEAAYLGSVLGDGSRVIGMGSAPAAPAAAADPVKVAEADKALNDQAVEIFESLGLPKAAAAAAARGREVIN